jgi:hypothetical protein
VHVSETTELHSSPEVLGREDARSSNRGGHKYVFNVATPAEKTPGCFILRPKLHVSLDALKQPQPTPNSRAIVDAPFFLKAPR